MIIFLHQKIPICFKLWIEQKEYKVNTYENRYLTQGVYNSEDSYGLKYYLIEMLGGILLNANSLAGYKKYEYEVLNDKVISLRKSIFEHAVFLCLNINWKEGENKYRDILLLDLLHFIYPVIITDKEIDSINKSLYSTFDKIRFKCSNFNLNVNHFIKKLLPNYIKSKGLFKTDPNDLQRVVKSSFLNDFIYAKEIGFGSLLSGGKDFIIFEKPGFMWDSDFQTNAFKITYPEAFIKYYS